MYRTYLAQRRWPAVHINNAGQVEYRYVEHITRTKLDIYIFTFTGSISLLVDYYGKLSSLWFNRNKFTVPK
jgi:hypothetical protein